jgi:hypothetical protein
VTYIVLEAVLPAFEIVTVNENSSPDLNVFSGIENFSLVLLLRPAAENIVLQDVDPDRRVQVQIYESEFPALALDASRSLEIDASKTSELLKG